MLTLPGSYHAGFSTGLNIGEAVNFASKSWIPFGAKAQVLYRATREKIPVFPCEWLLIKNIQMLDTIKIDADTRNAIAEAYKVWCEAELHHRGNAERTISG